MQWPPGAGCVQQQQCCPQAAASSATKPKAYRYISHASYWGQTGAKDGPRGTSLVMQCHGTCPGRESLACLHVTGVEMAHVSLCESHCSAFCVPFTTLVSSVLLQEFFDFTSIQFCTSPVIKKHSKPIMAKIDSPSEQGSTSPPSPHEAV